MLEEGNHESCESDESLDLFLGTTEYAEGTEKRRGMFYFLSRIWRVMDLPAMKMAQSRAKGMTM